MNFTDIEEYFLNKIPTAYREFMLEIGGGHFDDVLLYCVEDLIERNECYETKEYAPGWIAIGDDGGGRAIIISLSDDDPQVFIVHHGIMEPDEAEQVFDCFTSWRASYFSINKHCNPPKHSSNSTSAL